MLAAKLTGRYEDRLVICVIGFSRDNFLQGLVELLILEGVPLTRLLGTDFRVLIFSVFSLTICELFDRDFVLDQRSSHSAKHFGIQSMSMAINI